MLEAAAAAPSRGTIRLHSRFISHYHIIVIIDEGEVTLGEAGADVTVRHPPSSCSGTHKEALRHAKSTLNLNDYVKSLETIVILIFLVEKPARICRRMMAELGNKRSANSGNTQVSTSLDVGCGIPTYGFYIYEAES